MAWWGTIIGGTLGYMIGGPLGALLGGALGRRIDSSATQGRLGHYASVGDQERVQTAFFTATFSVMGYIAKADGYVSAAEIRLANQVMAQMRLTEQQKTVARSLFDQGKHADFALDEVLDQFRRECSRRINLIRMFIEIQVQAALADGRLDSQENQALLHVAERLGIPHWQFEQLLRMAQGAARGGPGAAPSTAPPLAADYQILGIPKSAGNDELKRAYRRLMNQHHPDKLIAKGLPEEMVRLATEKTQQIQGAYERIKESRKTAA